MGKLLFFASSHQTGLSPFLVDQAIALQRNHVEMISVSGEKEQQDGLSEKMRKANVKLVRIQGLDDHGDFFLLVSELKKLLCEEQNINIVHVQTNWQLVLMVFAKFITLKWGLKIIYTLHFFRNNSRFKSAIARVIMGIFLFLFAHKVICTCSYLKRNFNFLGRRIVILPLGVDDSYLEETRPNAPTKGLQMIFPAFFRKGKNQQLLVKAFAKHIKNTGDSLSSLILPGMGEYYDSVKQLATDLGIPDRVSFPGYTSKAELKKMYLNSNIGIVSSVSETFCQAIVEPFVLGRCVITTHVGVADDIIINGENGFLFSKEDELVGVFDKLYQNSDSIQQIGEKNFKLRSQFSWDVISEKYKKEFLS